MDYSDWIVAALIALEITGIAMAARAIMTTRTSQGAVAWSIALIAFPLASLPLYAVFGRRKFQGYVEARRAEIAEIQPVLDKLKQRASRDAGIDPAIDTARLGPLAQLARMPFSRGNETRVLVDGYATFAAIFAAFEAARHYVLVEYYILRDDRIGRELQRRLLARLEEGVRVFLLCDGVGSKGLSPYLAELTSAGARIAVFGVGGRLSRRLQLNFRNHRKIVVVDGKTGFVGGLNVGDEYLGRDPRHRPWRDTHVEIRGPAVLALQITFLEDWYDTTAEVPDLDWEPMAVPGADKQVLILPSGPADTLETCGLLFAHLINRAYSRVWIVSPYFVPDEAIVSALQLAALRGVDVRILLPARSDNRLVQLAGYSYFDETRAAGVTIYRYQAGFLHQKVVLVDDDIATVGTANFDNRSFRLNFEVTAVVADREFTAEIASMLQHDFDASQRVSSADIAGRGWPFRVAVRAARLLSPVL